MNERDEFAYPGGELELFAQARNWKDYWSSLLLPYLQGDVLEAGAGIGTNTRILRNNRQQRWVCLEPDRRLLEQLKSGLERQPAQGLCELFRGTVADLTAGERFDAILYIDVLEHIDDDRSELSRAARHLKPGGHLVVLSPANQILFWDRRFVPVSRILDPLLFFKVGKSILAVWTSS